MARRVVKTDSSMAVVYAALAGNVAVAAAKFGAYAFSGSSALLTEAIHSLVDSADQVLLLVGHARGGRPPDVDHPFGHGMETYFWSFIVAVMVLLAGGFASVYEGIRHVAAPASLESPVVSGVVLALAALFEGASLAVGIREYRRIVRGMDVPLWDFILLSKDPRLYASLLEDSAALIGIAIAALGVFASSALHIAWADGVASIGIGILLTCVAFILANETRSLIAGEAVAPAVMERLRKVLRDDERIETVAEIATVHLGPRAILVALTVHFKPDITIAGLKQAIRDVTNAMREADDRVAYVYVRPAAD
jgi:cation diffusion facilitator family transporter